MQFVKAQDLKVGDRLILGDKSHRVDDVAVSQVNVAVRSATYPVPVLHSRGTEVLIEDRVKPEPTPPAPSTTPRWYLRYSACNGQVAATFYNDMRPRLAQYGPFCDTEAEALAGLLQLWAQEIEAATCAVNGCDHPRAFGSTLCGRPGHWRA